MARTFEQMSDDRLDRDIRNHCEPRPSQEMVECAKCHEVVPKNETFTDFEDEVGGRTCGKCTDELIEQASHDCSQCSQSITACKC